MKKTLRFAALAAVLGLASWSNAGAQFPYYCSQIDGTTCSTPGAFQSCPTPYVGESGGCTCTTNHTWRCYW
jgi:hypothetical protein